MTIQTAKYFFLLTAAQQYPRDPTIVAASGRANWKYERLDDVVGVPQTKVTFSGRYDIGGAVPTFLMNKLAKNVAKNLVMMREKFDRSLDIDRARR